MATSARNGLGNQEALDKLANFNLNSDRGYAYLCWDWRRPAEGEAAPYAFKGNPGPGPSGAPTKVSQHIYRTPLRPGYGWDQTDLLTATNPAAEPSIQMIQPRTSRFA